MELSIDENYKDSLIERVTYVLLQFPLFFFFLVHIGVRWYRHHMANRGSRRTKPKPKPSSRLGLWGSMVLFCGLSILDEVKYVCTVPLTVKLSTHINHKPYL